MKKTMCVLVSAVFIFSMLCFGGNSAFSTSSALKALEEKIKECKTYNSFENLVAEIKRKIAKNPKASDVDILYYALAEARIKELSYLAKQNDIESVRRYMKVNDKYYDEVIENLDKAKRTTQSAELKLDILFLKFLVAKEKFQTNRVDALFNEIVNKIVSFSNDRTINKHQLERIAGKFNEAEMPDHAMGLKAAYVKKADKESAIDVTEDIKQEADYLFEQGDLVRADMLYQKYIDLSKNVSDESVVASKIAQIGDKYFSEKKYSKALRYYEEYLRTYSGKELTDYCSYKVGVCLYYDNDHQAAAKQLNSFLEEYPQSKWFRKGYNYLAKIYYENPWKKKALEDLKALGNRYKNKNVRDYSDLLIALLHYGDEEYDKALSQCKGIIKDFPESSYYYATTKLIEDIENIMKKGEDPLYSYGSRDTYRQWDPYTPITGKITPVLPESMTAYKGLFGIAYAYAAEDDSYPDKAEIVSVKGDVYVMLSGRSNWIDATYGMMLNSGDKIKTGKDSSCDISFDVNKKNVVGILKNSEVILLFNKDEKLEVIDAYIFARLMSLPKGSSFKVKTPIAVCSARGTSFGLKSDENQAQATAYEHDIYIESTVTGGVGEDIKEGFKRVALKSGRVSEEEEANPEDVAEFQSWPVYITVKPGTTINLNIEELIDVDRFGEYIKDESDASRLPRKIEELKEEDLVAIEWSADSGTFKNNKNTVGRTWTAPRKPGTYKISANTVDLGLVRPPDEGTRKDLIPHDMTVMVTVAE